MKLFWQYSVAVLLGVASISPAWAQQQQPPRGNAAQRVPMEQRQAAQGIQRNPNGGVFQGQGVNRNPGQEGAQFQQPQDRQFLGNNRQGQVNTNQRNAVDEFGANVNRANQVINEQNNLDQLAMGQNSLDNGNSPNGSDQLFGSGPASSPANFGGMYGTSSMEEGILTGQARYLQGAGEYNRNSAEAVKTLEQARALNLENRRTGLKTYFELKDMNSRYRSEHAPMPVSKEKMDEWNREDQPQRLSRREYNADTGRVQWPSVLMTPAFDGYRVQIEALFARRAANEFGVNSDFYRMVNQDTTTMRDLLKSYLQSGDKFFSDQEYIAAQNFLNSLAHEARLAPDLDGLAAN